MKIFYLCGFDLLSGVAAAKRVLNVAKALQLCSHEIKFIDASDTVRDYTWNGFKVTSVIREKNFVGQVKSKIAHRDIERIIGNNADVVIAYNYPGLSLIQIERYCRKRNIRIIADVADWPTPNGAVFRKLIMSIDIKTRMTKAHLRMDGLIVISDYLAHYYRNQPLVVIPPMVDITEVKKTVCYSSYSDDCIMLTTINTAGPEKEALNQLFKMLSIVKERLNRRFALHVIGMTEEQYERRYHECVPQNIKNDVSFCGRLSYEETIKRIASSAYFVFLRNHSQLTDAGFPTKFTEAMSCGTPVITTKTSDLERYLQVGENGFFIESEDELIFAMEKDNEEINYMKKYCENYMQFDFHEYASILDRFFIDVVKDGGI